MKFGNIFTIANDNIKIVTPVGYDRMIVCA
jgi:hypothetical protein